MPIIKSARKRARQTAKRRAHNQTYKAAIKERTQDLMEAIANKDVKAIDESLSAVYKAYDKAVKKNLLHEKTAARRKSHLNGLAKDAKGAKTTTKKASTKKPTAKKPATKKSSK